MLVLYLLSYIKFYGPHKLVSGKLNQSDSEIVFEIVYKFTDKHFKY